MKLARFVCGLRLLLSTVLLLGTAKTTSAQWFRFTLDRIDRKETQLAYDKTWEMPVYVKSGVLNYSLYASGAWSTVPYPSSPVSAAHPTGGFPIVHSGYHWAIYRAPASPPSAATNTLRFVYPYLNNWYDAYFPTPYPPTINGIPVGVDPVSNSDRYYFTDLIAGGTYYLKYYQPSGSTWGISTVKALDPAVSSFGIDTYYRYVHYVSPADSLFHTLSPASPSWNDTATGSLKAIPNGRIAFEAPTHVSFYIGSGGTICYTTYVNGWTSGTLPAPSGAPISNASTVNPAVACDSSPYRSTFYRGVDGNVWYTQVVNGVWQTPAFIKTPLLDSRSNLLVNRNSSGAVDGFYIGLDGRVRGFSTVSGKGMTDSDGDGLPASVDGNDGNADADNDGITDALEVNLYGTNPALAQSDLDAEGMPTSIKTFWGLSSSDGAFDDTDGDRYPNIFEIFNGSDPKDNKSIPQAAAVVDPGSYGYAQDASVYSTIGYALSQSSGLYPIILVKPGVYREKVVIEKSVLLMPADVGSSVSIAPLEAGPAISINKAGAMVREITISGALRMGDGYGVDISTWFSTRPCYLVGCIIGGHYSNNSLHSGLGVRVTAGEAVVEHCTIYSNGGLAEGKSVYLGGSQSKLTARNSIFWGGSYDGGTEVVADASVPGANVQTASQNLIRGTPGAVDPALHPLGFLTGQSGSAFGGGGAVKLSTSDIQGEGWEPGTSHGIGADEFVDTDNDGLPDWWEQKYFGSLTAATATGDNDNDGLLNRYEYHFSYSPLNGYSNGGPTGDYLAALNQSYQPWCPLDWAADADGDGLIAVWEVYYGSSDANPDSNGDGLGDGIGNFGYNPMAADIDGDGLNASQEAAKGTHPLMADTDGDGVNDNLDAYPLDRTRSTAPAGSAQDATPPQLFLDLPVNATPL